MKSIGNNLKLGRSIEKSLFNSLLSLELNNEIKSKWIKLLNLGTNYIDIFEILAKESDDKTLSRVWILLSKISHISTLESGDKILEITDNLEKNKQLTEKRNSLIKAQKYKIYFLGIMTSVFLGIISGLSPLFATFVSIFRNVTISDTVIKLIPFSLYLISTLSVYFTSDISLEKFNIKIFLFSSLAYVISYFIAKAIIIAIL